MKTNTQLGQRSGVRYSRVELCACASLRKLRTSLTTNFVSVTSALLCFNFLGLSLNLWLTTFHTFP